MQATTRGQHCQLCTQRWGREISIILWSIMKLNEGLVDAGYITGATLSTVYTEMGKRDEHYRVL